MTDKMSLDDYENSQPIALIKTECGGVKFAVPNSVTGWRAQTLFTKEPDTIAWIREFEPGEVFVDIGANVGMYAI